MKSSLKVAIVQDGPVYLNLQKSLEKAESLIMKAAKKQVELIVFGETWLSGYPVWLDYIPNMGLWGHEPTKAVFAEMLKNSISVDGTEIHLLKSWAKQYQINIVMGANESTSSSGIGTIYNSILMFDKSGDLANHHRKLMPTYTEKMVYGMGDGAGLKVIDTDFGKLGALVCWEHWMPLTRQAMHNAGESIHIALWPKVHEMHQVASRQYAFEGRCFVIAVGQLMKAKELPSAFELPETYQSNPEALLLDGGSCIVGPDGFYRLEPQWGEGELLFHEIQDLDQIYRERMTLDVTGHYQRKDVFEFKVDAQRRN